MSRHDEISELLRQTGSGRVSDSAYDVGWVAQLGDTEPELAEGALEWLRGHQLPDGTWGSPDVDYQHDRVICTLSAVIALARSGRGSDARLIERAKPALLNRMRRLGEDAAGETIGFEVLAPALLHRARELRLLDGEVDDALAAKRAEKLALAPPGMVNNRSTMAHSAEMAGLDGLRILDLENLQAHNGSVGFSPAATAFHATVAEKNQEALAYLRQISNRDGGVPNVGPVDVFEIAWTLWNLGLTQYPAGPEHLLGTLEEAWTQARGVSFGAGFTPEDGDDTAVTFEVLARSGRAPDMDALLSYEGPDYFYCWPTERNSSLSTNVHVLGALRAAGLPGDHPRIEKTIRYFADRQHQDGHWIDKWHVSPNYATAHAVIAGAGYADPMFDRAVEWMLDSQRPNGSWGSQLPTAEETAYCLQALTIVRRGGGEVPEDAVRRGYEWLSRHATEPYPWLWIGKCLYSPDVVVRSAVLSALTLVEEDT